MEFSSKNRLPKDFEDGWHLGEIVGTAYIVRVSKNGPPEILLNIAMQIDEENLFVEFIETRLSESDGQSAEIMAAAIGGKYTPSKEKPLEIFDKIIDKRVYFLAENAGVTEVISPEAYQEILAAKLTIQPESSTGKTDGDPNRAADAESNGSAGGGAV